MNIFKKNKSLPIRQSGSGMIEVLVALVVLAIGLLGVLSMQARGLNSNQRAIFTTDVTLLANEMADHILSYYSEVDTTTVTPNEFDGVSTVNGSGYSGADPVVSDAQQQWINTLLNDPADANSGNRLPSGRGDVAWSTTNNSYTITIRWDTERTGATGTDCDNQDARDSANNLINLTCYQLELDF